MSSESPGTCCAADVPRHTTASPSRVLRASSPRSGAREFVLLIISLSDRRAAPTPSNNGPDTKCIKLLGYEQNSTGGEKSKKGVSSVGLTRKRFEIRLDTEASELGNADRLLT